MDIWTFRIRLKKINKRLKKANKDLSNKVPSSKERVKCHEEKKLVLILSQP